MNKKLIVKILLVIFGIIIFCGSMFLVYQRKEEMKFVEQYRINHFDRLRTMRGIIYDIEYYSDEELQHSRYTYYMDYPDTNYRVNLWDLNYYIYLYNLSHENDLNLTAEEIINLYYVFDEEKDADFDMLYEWYYGENGIARIKVANEALTQALLLYYQDNGELYCGVNNIEQLSYEELINFIEWVLANPDYEFAAEYDEYYLLLEWVGLVSKSEKCECIG